MSLTNKQVKKIASLARIKLSEDEVEHFSSELSNILDWIETLQEVDTDNVPQMSSVSSVNLPLRRDEVTDGDIQQDILSNAPQSSFGCFEVPKVVE